MTKHAYIFAFIPLFLVGATYLSANTISPGDCDTLVTASGTRIIVNNISVEGDYYTYYLCGSAVGTKRKMATAKVREIRFAQVEQASPAVISSQDTNKVSTHTRPYQSTEPKPQKIENSVSTMPVEQVNRLAKIAALNGLGGVFLVLAGGAIHPIFFLLAIAGLILGLIYGLKGVRAARKRPELRKAHRLAKWGYLIPLIMFGIIMLSYVLSPVIFLFALFFV
jgi:hypothetical protein